MSQRWQVMADRMHPSREDRQRRREVNWRRFGGSESRDELTIIPTTLESVMTGSAVGRGGMPGQLLHDSMYQSLFQMARSKAWSQRITVWTPMIGNMRAMARARRARRV